MQECLKLYYHYSANEVTHFREGFNVAKGEELLQEVYGSYCLNHGFNPSLR